MPAEQVAKTLSHPGFGFDMVRGSDGVDVNQGFGTEPFGHIEGLKRERVQIPRDAQRGGFHSLSFRTREAGAFWKLHGLTLDFEATGIKGVR
jgi:hypothetical protein